MTSSPPQAADREGPWSIAQVADAFGVTHRTVRHYEDLRLIAPERRGTQRLYHRRDRTRLGLILRGKRLGFPLEEIRTIIDQDTIEELAEFERRCRADLARVSLATTSSGANT